MVLYRQYSVLNFVILFVCLNQAAVKRVPLMGRRGAVYCLDIGSWGHLVSVHLP